MLVSIFYFFHFETGYSLCWIGNASSFLACDIAPKRSLLQLGPELLCSHYKIVFFKLVIKQTKLLCGKFNFIWPPDTQHIFMVILLSQHSVFEVLIAATRHLTISNMHNSIKLKKNKKFTNKFHNLLWRTHVNARVENKCCMQHNNALNH